MTLSLITTTEDASLDALARAFWALDDGGKWVYRIAELAERFGEPVHSVHHVVRKVCQAYCTSVRCARGGEPLPVQSRSAYETMVRNRPRPYGRATRLLCASCEREERAERIDEMQKAVERKRQAIDGWLEQMAGELHTKKYAEAPLKDAFFLDGLLRYAGDAWKGNRLDAQRASVPRLCPSDEDTARVYLYLFERGWISPANDSPHEAFVVGADGEVSIRDVALVNWILASDSEAEGHDGILNATEAILDDVPGAELSELWYWVGLCELRSQFNKLHDEFRFLSKGWTPGVEEGLRGLLRDCSLGHAMKIVYLSLRNLSVELQRRRYNAQHVYNMIPSSFRRQFDWHQANGYQFDPLPRLSPPNEAVYTGLLFDKVMGGGKDLHIRLTGASLAALG